MDDSCRGQDRSPGVLAGVPDLERLCYFFGQLLEPADFRAEQQYFSTLLSLLTRHGVGWGVACGLDVSVSEGPPERCDDQPRHELLVLCVTPGVAVDACGRFAVLRSPYQCRLWDLTGQEERDALLHGRPVFVAVEVAQRPVRPSRVVGDAGCDPLSAVQYGRIRDEARIVVTTEPPEAPRCGACLGGCGDCRVLLAELQLTTGDVAGGVSVRTEVRRLLARHELATITGLGWVHNGVYGRRAAETLLASGVGVRFSLPVHEASITDGLVDLVVYEGGGGRREGWYVKEAALEPAATSGNLFSELTVRAAQPEGFQAQDRIMVRLRCDFLLDECCRAVSGAHVGGGVPFDPTLSRASIEHPAPPPRPCPSPPDRSGPWRSGNGVEGGTFETWITVGGDDAGDRR